MTARTTAHFVTALDDRYFEIENVHGEKGARLAAESHTAAIDRIEAIVLSMTAEERRRPELIKGSRRLRIAQGSGTSVQQVNQLVKQFGQMRKMMKGLTQGKMPDLGALMRGGR